MFKIKFDNKKLASYIISNKDRSITDVYTELKNKKRKELSNEELIVLTYLKLNARKLGLK